MDRRRPALISAYRAMALAAGPLFGALFAARVRAGKEIADRRGERFGHASAGRPDGRLVWIHAASVGETMSVIPLAYELDQRGCKILLTTVTVTAAELAKSRFPNSAIHQFVPFDSPLYFRRFLDHWRPNLSLVVESEIWPNMLEATSASGTPQVLVNGRLSDRSFRGWKRLGRSAAHVFQCIDLVLAQTQADADRYRQVGCRHVETSGNLKFDTPALPADETAVVEMREGIGARPTWMAALTHPGEEELALAAHKAVLDEFPDALLFIVPRHPQRADGVHALIASEGLKPSRRSASDAIEPDTQVYLGDTLGEMGLFYRLTPLVFLGGSFVDVGGHNPVEAALLDTALMTGPKVGKTRAVYKALWDADAACRLSSPQDLEKAVVAFLREPKRAAAQIDRARAAVLTGRGALARTLEQLSPYLAPVRLGGEPEASS